MSIASHRLSYKGYRYIFTLSAFFSPFMLCHSVEATNLEDCVHLIPDHRGHTSLRCWLILMIDDVCTLDETLLQLS